MNRERKAGLTIIAVVISAIIFTGIVAVIAAKMSETAAC